MFRYLQPDDEGVLQPRITTSLINNVAKKYESYLNDEGTLHYKFFDYITTANVADNKELALAIYEVLLNLNAGDIQIEDIFFFLNYFNLTLSDEGFIELYKKIISDDILISFKKNMVMNALKSKKVFCKLSKLTGQSSSDNNGNVTENALNKAFDETMASINGKFVKEEEVTFPSVVSVLDAYKVNNKLLYNPDITDFKYDNKKYMVNANISYMPSLVAHFRNYFDAEGIYESYLADVVDSEDIKTTLNTHIANRLNRKIFYLNSDLANSKIIENEKVLISKHRGATDSSLIYNPNKKIGIYSNIYDENVAMDMLNSMRLFKKSETIEISGNATINVVPLSDKDIEKALDRFVLKLVEKIDKYNETINAASASLRDDILEMYSSEMIIKSNSSYYKQKLADLGIGISWSTLIKRLDALKEKTNDIEDSLELFLRNKISYFKLGTDFGVIDTIEEDLKNFSEIKDEIETLDDLNYYRFISILAANYYKIDNRTESALRFKENLLIFNDFLNQYKVDSESYLSNVMALRNYILEKDKRFKEV